MALPRHDLLRLTESLRTADGIELVRVPAQRILQELIEAEATAHIGAEPGEHAETRTTRPQRAPGEGADHAGRGPGHDQRSKGSDKRKNDAPNSPKRPYDPPVTGPSQHARRG
jgi:hypothetical protein